jgi:hypothetical protein
MAIKEIQNWLIIHRNTFTENDIEQLCLQNINKTIQHIEKEGGKGISGIKSMISHRLNPEYFQRERLNEETSKCIECGEVIKKGHKMCSACLAENAENIY